MPATRGNRELQRLWRGGLGLGLYILLVTGVTLWVSLDWLQPTDQPDFAGVWLTVVAPQADLPCRSIPGLKTLSGQHYLLGFYGVFVVEILLAWWVISRLRRRSQQ